MLFKSRDLLTSEVANQISKPDAIFRPQSSRDDALPYFESISEKFLHSAYSAGLIFFSSHFWHPLQDDNRAEFGVRAWRLLELIFDRYFLEAG
jgi:hypothetical protein